MKSDIKSAEQIMIDAGFNPNGSHNAKAAFVKYLVKKAYNKDIEIPQIIDDLDAALNKSEVIQLEFGFEDFKIAK